MAEKGMELTYDDSVIDYLVKTSYSVTYGARNLRRAVQKDIEDKIAAEIIDNYAGDITKVGITAVDGKISVLAV